MNSWQFNLTVYAAIVLLKLYQHSHLILLLVHCVLQTAVSVQHSSSFLSPQVCEFSWSFLSMMSATFHISIPCPLAGSSSIFPRCCALHPPNLSVKCRYCSRLLPGHWCSSVNTSPCERLQVCKNTPVVKVSSICMVAYVSLWALELLC